MKKIDIESITIPKIDLTEDAASQILLALENNPYTIGKFFRIHISGKGCDGFSYQTLFDDKSEEDLIIQIKSLQIIMAPFTAYYSSHLKIDYIFNDTHNVEGFIVTNLNQHKFKGKFWREHPERTPNLIR